jgi:hypothetical protein
MYKVQTWSGDTKLERARPISFFDLGIISLLGNESVNFIDAYVLLRFISYWYIYIYMYTCFEDTIFEFPLVAGLISTCGKMTSLGKMKTKMAASINQYSGMLYSHGWLTDLKFNPVYRNINEINE